MDVCPAGLAQVTGGPPLALFADGLDTAIYQLDPQRIDVLIASGVADPDRLGIGGGSHGGFMTAWAIGQTDRFSAALVARIHARLAVQAMSTGKQRSAYDLMIAATSPRECPQAPPGLLER